jgi:hypothetical protein
MELHEALRQIDAMRGQMARTEVFRGYRAPTVAATGLLALAAASLQGWIVPEPRQEMGRYLLLWIGVAAISASAVAIELAARWLRSDSPLARRQTRQAVEQFAPCLLAGAALTWAIAGYLPEAAVALPGLWAIVFSLGVFASWRQLTPRALIVAAHYLTTGVACLMLARDAWALSPWAMAATFGVGQLLTAAVLHWDTELRADDQALCDEEATDGTAC